MAVIDAVGETLDEFDGINSLPQQMARVKVETEFTSVADRIQRLFRGINVVCDLSRVNFKSELHIIFRKNIHDRIEKLRKTALLYLSAHSVDLQPRFDVAEVYAPYGADTQNPTIHYLEDAFQ